MKIKIISLSLLLPVLLSCGAGIVSRPYKEGVSYSDFNKIVTYCDMYAARNVPANIVVSQTPSYTTPIQTYCTSISGFISCSSVGGNTIGGDIVSRDSNALLRENVKNQCYSHFGVRFYNIRPCTSSEASRYTPSSYLPKMQANTCYVSLPGNKIAYYSPAQ